MLDFLSLPILAYVAVGVPLLTFIVALLGRSLVGDKGAQAITTLGMLLSASASAYIFYQVAYAGAAQVVPITSWITLGNLRVDWALRLDTLSTMMMAVVTIVSACVHLYAVGYMSEDKGIPRFMAYLSIFTFFMLMLVTADNLVQVFFGWEGVGVASYLLIGFWYHKPSANAAAIKAFLVNRVGDIGLALGIFACFALFGSVNFDSIFTQLPALRDATFDFLGLQVHALTLIGLLLFIGAMGKSAQLGLHTWLPDAMEGPTPVSALIHAATMVTAGVFLVARMSPLYEFAPLALAVIMLVGILTAFFAATIELTQNDIKRVIAFSTCSQLGYMFFACGVSAYSAAMFHLMTHAFFKALLFLTAGSVIHALIDHQQDIRKMGGLWKKMPLTYGLSLLATLSLAGAPLFAGYYSKHIILESAYVALHPLAEPAFWLGVVVAGMTAFYSFRMLFMVYHGATRCDKNSYDHAHESPVVMWLPMALLAVGAVITGAVFYDSFVGKDHKTFWHDSITVAPQQDVVATLNQLHHATHVASDATHQNDGKATQNFVPHPPLAARAEVILHEQHWLKDASTFAAVVGLVLAVVFYLWQTRWPSIVARRAAGLYRFLLNRWYIDELYEIIFLKPLRWTAHFFASSVDRRLIDALPNGVAWLARCGGRLLGRGQTGFVYHYAFVMLIGLVLLVSYSFWRFMQ